MKATASMNHADSQKREHLWWALSDLWLDTEPDEHTYKGIVNAMVDSNYSLPELKSIFAFEVAPAVYKNLFNIFPGGEWGAFDRECLVSSIHNAITKQSRNALYQAWVHSRFGQTLMTSPVRRHWYLILEMYRDTKAR